MKKINDLHAFILGLQIFAAEQLDSFVDNLTITPAFRPSGVPGEMIVAEKDYNAAFFIERYPHAITSEDIFIAYLAQWLMIFDPTRLDETKVELTIDVLDSNTANIEFSIHFNEYVMADEHPAGNFIFNNKRYFIR